MLCQDGLGLPNKQQPISFAITPETLRALTHGNNAASSADVRVSFD